MDLLAGEQLYQVFKGEIILLLHPCQQRKHRNLFLPHHDTCKFYHQTKHRLPQEKGLGSCTVIAQKVLSGKLSNQVQQCRKRIVHNKQVGCIVSMQGCFGIWKLANSFPIINRLKSKNYMTVSIDAENRLDKSVMTKAIHKLKKKLRVNWENKGPSTA